MSSYNSAPKGRAIPTDRVKSATGHVLTQFNQPRLNAGLQSLQSITQAVITFAGPHTATFVKGTGIYYGSAVQGPANLNPALRGNPKGNRGILFINIHSRDFQSRSREDHSQQVVGNMTVAVIS